MKRREKLKIKYQKKLKIENTDIYPKPTDFARAFFLIESELEAITQLDKSVTEIWEFRDIMRKDIKDKIIALEQIISTLQNLMDFVGGINYFQNYFLTNKDKKIEMLVEAVIMQILCDTVIFIEGEQAIFNESGVVSDVIASLKKLKSYDFYSSTSTTSALKSLF